jgi:hypothetical protein
MPPAVALMREPRVFVADRYFVSIAFMVLIRLVLVGVGWLFGCH